MLLYWSCVNVLLRSLIVWRQRSVMAAVGSSGCGAAALTCRGRDRHQERAPAAPTPSRTAKERQAITRQVMNHGFWKSGVVTRVTMTPRKVAATALTPALQAMIVPRLSDTPSSVDTYGIRSRDCQGYGGESPNPQVLSSQADDGWQGSTRG